MKIRLIGTNDDNRGFKCIIKNYLIKRNETKIGNETPVVELQTCFSSMALAICQAWEDRILRVGTLVLRP